MRELRRPAGILTAAAIAFSLLAGPASAESLGTEVLKGAAVAYAVKIAAKPLNSFINTITLRNHMPTRLATKVVPIISVGSKAYVGGAQVCGPKWMVEQVHAVFQYEQNIATNNYRVKVLVPSASLNPLGLKRVQKVGISATIDVSVDGALRYQTVGTGIHAGDIIRGAAVLAAVKVAGPQINKAVNLITLNKGEATKVVPWGSFGDKAYLGGAQVASASPAMVNKVHAVWQYEGLFMNGQFRVKVLLPVTAINPIGAKRVDGAGVTAVVDMALSPQTHPEPAVDAGGVLGGFFRKGRDEARPADEGRDDDDQGRHDNGRHLGWRKGRGNPHRGD